MPLINIIDDRDIVGDDDIEVWLDPGDVGGEGLCIGVGSTRARAIDDAIGELEARIVDLRTLRAQERDDAGDRIGRHVN